MPVKGQFPYVSTALPLPEADASDQTVAPRWPGIDNAAGLLVTSPNSPASFFASSDTKRSYLLRVAGERDITHPMGVGGVGVDDAAIFALYRSRASDGVGVQQRGLNAQVNHRGLTGGSIGNLIGSNASTSTVLAGDDVALTCVNENYAPATGGFSGVLDLLHLHEGPNAVGGEFGIRIRNQKKNGSQIGSFIKVQNDVPATTMFKYGLDLQDVAAAGGVSTLKGDIVLGSKDVNGLPAIIASGAAVNDGAIVAQVGADTLWADGSLYISVVDGAGTFWQKRNDVWTSI